MVVIYLFVHSQNCPLYFQRKKTQKRQRYAKCLRVQARFDFGMRCKTSDERLAFLVGYLDASCMFTKPAKAMKENF